MRTHRPGSGPGSAHAARDRERSVSPAAESSMRDWNAVERATLPRRGAGVATSASRNG